MTNVKPVPVAATLEDAAADPALTLDVARELLRDAAAGIRQLAASATPRAEPAEGLWRCTICGRVGTVGRCCGEETRERVSMESLQAEIMALRAEEREQRDEALLRQALEALGRAHQTAMEQTLKANAPRPASRSWKGRPPRSRRASTH